ncbi:hypothetical protein Tco_0145121 [Tanacetum coccineum]
MADGSLGPCTLMQWKLCVPFMSWQESFAWEVMIAEWGIYRGGGEAGIGEDFRDGEAKIGKESMDIEVHKVEEMESTH